MNLKGFVYILQSERNGTFYIGSTNDVERRVFEHQIGHVKSTKNLRPLILKFFKEYDTLIEARKIEYKLKSLKSKKIIECIIEEKDIKLKLDKL
jgi:putative endonuclease